MKIKVYAISQGYPKAYVLLQDGNPIPDGYTSIEPPDPQEGCKVIWNGSHWIQEPDAAIIGT